MVEGLGGGDGAAVAVVLIVDLVAVAAGVTWWRSHRRRPWTPSTVASGLATGAIVLLAVGLTPPSWRRSEALRRVTNHVGDPDLAAALLRGVDVAMLTLACGTALVVVARWARTRRRPTRAGTPGRRSHRT